jgi:hypothetical protein
MMNNLRGITIDYHDSPYGAGFIVDTGAHC